MDSSVLLKRQNVEQMTFAGHMRHTTLGFVLAIFTDLQSGQGTCLTKVECEARLANLKAQNAACEETEKALASWPE